MIDVYRFSEPQLLSLVLVFLRVSTFVAVWPIFGVESVPMQLKILLGLVLSLMLQPVLSDGLLVATPDPAHLILLVAKEVFVGLIFGYLARMFFMVLKMMGEMISVSIGLSGAQLYNPAMGGMSAPTDTLYFTLGGLIYLALNGHHHFLAGLVDTFRIIPASQMGVDLSSMVDLGQLVQGAIASAVSMAAPVFVAILFANIAMGILGKTVPQINVLITSLAVNTLIGFVVMILAMPATVDHMGSILDSSVRDTFRLMARL